MKRRKQRGLVLILVLVAVVLMAFAAYTFTGLMLNERQAVELSAHQVQARAQVESGVDHLRRFLALSEEERAELGGVFDNPTKFRGLIVQDDIEPQLRGRVTMIAPNIDDSGRIAGIRYGLSDESARLNINALLLADEQMEGGGQQLLMALPGMTIDVADAILDWIDEDAEPRENGCEGEYYSGLTPGYAPRNGPLETVEELLLVRGVTPELLFGIDTNRNGVIDMHERNGDSSSASPDGVAPLSGASSRPNTQGTPLDVTISNDPAAMEVGWAAYLTLYSMEKNARSDGTPRINLNSTNLQQLNDDLTAVFPPDWVNHIIGYRLYGPYVGNKAGVKGQSGQLDLQAKPRFPITQPLDLIGTKVQVKFTGANENVVLETPFESNPIAMGIYLPLLLDNVTVNPSNTIPGRININQAPRSILMGIPGITEEMVAEILSRRTPEAEENKPNRRFETWLMVEGVCTIEEMRILMPFVCGSGNVVRTQVVGYFDGGGPSARSEVIIDATRPFPRIVFWRELSHLGRGFALETLGMEAAVP